MIETTNATRCSKAGLTDSHKKDARGQYKKSFKYADVKYEFQNSFEHDVKIDFEALKLLVSR